jgi:protein involved in polysaccharide export with SLBB domain
MNKLKFLPLLLISSSAFSQAVNEEFLKSLPEDIRNDFIEQQTKIDGKKETNYRSSKISTRLEHEEDLLALKSRLEEDLEELESRLNDELLYKNKEDLELFGLDFFDTFQTSFMPINEANPDPFYLLDTGDILKVQFIGQQDFVDTYTINKDGSINLPDIGKIVIAGLELKEASAMIKSLVNLSFLGTEVFVSLEELRDVNVLISGSAQNPGIYTLTGNSNMLHALIMAGGINKFGSYREINLYRKNVLIETLDVYDLLIAGNYSLKKRLRSGDVIFVEGRKNVVTINGAVKRPAKYEIKDDEFLDKVISFSNGYKRTADLENIYLERILDGSLKSIPIKNTSQFKSIKPYDGDLIYFREYPYRKASISGAVLKPGRYTMTAGENLDDLIKKAGGVTKDSYMFGAIYENDEAKIINKKANEILYRDFLEKLVIMSQQNISSGNQIDITPLINIISEIKNTKSNGRVVVDLLNEDTKNSHAIKDGDSLFIPEKNNSVYVYGEISSQGAVIYKSNEDVEYFVEKSGGYKKFADIDAIYILQPNGDTIRHSVKRSLFESQPIDAVKIYPGSVIFVPKRIDDSNLKRLTAQAYVSILGNIGIALASLSAIKD